MAPVQLAGMVFRPTPASSACCASDLSIRLLCYMELEWPRFLLTHLLSSCTDYYYHLPNDHQPIELTHLSWSWSWSRNHLHPSQLLSIPSTCTIDQQCLAIPHIHTLRRTPPNPSRPNNIPQPTALAVPSAPVPIPTKTGQRSQISPNAEGYKTGSPNATTVSIQREITIAIQQAS